MARNQYSVLFDTSIATDNAGDGIIMDAVRLELHSTLDAAFFVSLPTHDYLGSVGKRWVYGCDLCFVGGTNLLSSTFSAPKLWRFSLFDTRLFKQKIILMGTGWWKYQENSSWLAAWMYRRILNTDPSIFHSVRDSYTEAKLRGMGISNVLNTACPTMWRLTPEHCATIPAQQGRRAVVTLTDFNRDVEADRALLKIISEAYEDHQVWVQGVGDLRYLHEIGVRNIAAPGLATLDSLLDDPETDFIGTRLHGGIRALQHGRRTIILAVDNRAKEIARDTNLPVVGRGDIEAIAGMIRSPFQTRIRLPQENIDRWKRAVADWYRNKYPELARRQAGPEPLRRTWTEPSAGGGLAMAGIAGDVAGSV